jgi:MFS family permease
MAALGALAQLPVLLVAAVPALVAGRVLLGAAEGPAAPISMYALFTHFPADKRGLPSSLQITGAALGTLIAAPILTWLITDFGWRSAFLAPAVVSATWALVWLKAGREGPFADRGDTRDARDPAPPRLPYRRLLRSGTAVGSIASAFGAQWHWR